MSKNDGGDKSCPILTASAAGRGDVSTGAYWASRCKRDGCGWWDDQHNACAVMAISQQIGALISAGFQARVA